MKGKSGVYQIRNLVNGKIYVGQSVDLYKRMHTHFSMLRWDYKEENIILRNAFKKYGEENFAFEVLAYCERHELTRYEQGLVDRLNPEYNIRKVCVDSPKGATPSEEIRKKISASKMGHPVSKATRDVLSQYKGERWGRFGSPVSDEHRKNLSAAGMGHGFSDETKRKISEKLKGRKLPEETRKKMSDAQKAKWAKIKEAS